MSFLKKIIGSNDNTIINYDAFWNWFCANEKTFHSVIRSRKEIEKRFLEKLSLKLTELKDGYYFLTGMYDENTAELIFTADGIAKNFVFVEELVAHAPPIEGWKFTAHKPPMDFGMGGLEMAGYHFDNGNLFFYSNDHAEFPDKIDISVIHTQWTEENKNEIETGCFIFLDNYLGEVNFLNNIDNIKVIGKHEAKQELVPIAKLSDFLEWRQKEFIEKYDGTRYNTQDDEHTVFEAELENGNRLIAVINTQLLDWDRKSSHPWIAVLTIKFDGQNNYGLPNDDDYQDLNEIEDNTMQQLSDKDGYLYVGRETADNERSVYFACKDFRKPSKVFYETQQLYDNKFEIEYDIYKDKYWQTYERFNPHH